MIALKLLMFNHTVFLIRAGLKYQNQINYKNDLIVNNYIYQYVYSN